MSLHAGLSPRSRRSRCCSCRGAELTFLAGGGVLEVEGGGCDLVGLLEVLVDTADAALTAHSGDLLEGFLLEGLADLRQTGEEDGVHLAGGVAVIDLDVCYGEEGGGEVACSGDNSAACY